MAHTNENIFESNTTGEAFDFSNKAMQLILDGVTYRFGRGPDEGGQTAKLERTPNNFDPSDSAIALSGINRIVESGSREKVEL